MISGILVVCAKEHLASVGDAIDALPFAEVHHTDAKGRLVAILEAKDAEQSIAYLQQIQGLPDVVMAEMAQFCIENDPQVADKPTPFRVLK